METRGTNTATVLGTEARIEIAATWYGPAKVTLINHDDSAVEEFDQSVTGRGMQYQAAEVERALRKGTISSTLMTPEDSVCIMATMDAIRGMIGLR